MKDVSAIYEFAFVAGKFQIAGKLMGMDINIFSAGWRRRFRRERLLGLKPEGWSASTDGLGGAGSITLVKRDNIGDFILATTFMNRACEAWAGREVTLVCTPHLEGLARAFYPEWNIKAVADSRQDYRWVWLQPKMLRHEVMSWRACDAMISLRALRRQDELVFDSWIPARRKIALENQLGDFEPRTMRRGLREADIYNEIVVGTARENAGAGSADGIEVCRDILNYRKLLDYCFPEKGGAGGENARAMPGFSRAFAARAAKMLPVLEKAHGIQRGKFLAVFPFASAAIKEYPAPLLARVVGEISDKYGLPVVVFGGAGDAAHAGKFLEEISVKQEKFSLAGRLDVAETAVCAGAAAGVLSMDSAGAHFGIVGGAPTVVILGGGHSGQFGPWGARATAWWVSHRTPCYDCSWNCKQPGVPCIREIPPDEIVDAFDAVF